MTTTTSPTISARERDSVIQSLRAGVVPRAGQQHIQVGRHREINTMVDDIKRVVGGGSTFRIVIGEYGAGKTFFLNLVKSTALQLKAVTINADLDPDRRLHASGGQARSLYAELMRNVATRTKPDGGALNGIVEKFIETAKNEATSSGRTTETVIREKLATLTEMVNGFDFADVIAAYCRGHNEDNETLKNDAVRWLRGEFTTKTDAKKALGVRTIVDDANVYDQLKLFASFVRLCGYSGLVCCLDELVNLYKLSNTQARNANYEQILRILNDSLQGNTVGLGFILGGTPEFLMDTRRGLFSYPALQTRLATNTFAKNGLIDLTGPVITLTSLTPEDFYVLLLKVRDVYLSGLSSPLNMPDEGIHAFMQHCLNKIGESYFRTPRTTITAFINLLAILEQNPEVKWNALINEVVISRDTGGDNDTLLDESDELATFKI